jgi:hypothetical protein
MAIGMVGIMAGLLALLVAALLWKGNRVGWFLVMLFLVLTAASGILLFPYGLILVPVAVLFLWYFLKTNVRMFFK